MSTVISGQGYNFVKPNDPILREVMPHVEVPHPTFDLKAIATNLWLTMRRGNGTDTGLGIAAPQVGLRLRMFVMHVQCQKQPFAMADVCINPVILKSLNAEVAFIEGCLSFPGERIKVMRPEGILAEWTTLSGKRVKKELYGLPARVFQHERDHMDGELIL
jgi:peptide deformylase